MVIEVVKSEFERYKSIAERAVEQLNESDLNKQLDSDGNSIAVLLKHLSGNLKSRFTNFLTEDGEKPWRDRDGEFESGDKSKVELLNNWNEAFNIVFDELKNLTEEKLDTKVFVYGKELTVAKALSWSLTHTSYHVGQIVLLAKHYAGRNGKH
jgi:uncharacterized damage-inducible protein DinB